MIKVTEEQFHALREDSMGICLNCKEEQDCCEPDARNYLCEYCGKKKVFGIEELLIMGLIEIIPEPELDWDASPENKNKTDKKIEQLRRQWEEKPPKKEEGA